jgi:hypothetical protein
MDRHGRTIFRTPYAQRLWRNTGHLNTLLSRVKHFVSANGVGQGDTHSAHTWRFFFDSLLRSLSHAHPTAVTLAYADDIITICISLGILQSHADIVSAFCNLTGLQLSTAKLRTFVKSPITLPDESISISSVNWEMEHIPVTQNGTLKYLGAHHDLSPRSAPTQVQTATSLLRNSIDTLLLKKSMYSSQLIQRVYMTKTVPQLLYGLSLTHFTTKQLDPLELLQRRLIKPITLNVMQFPTQLIHIH